MSGAYAVEFMVSGMNWLTTVGDEDSDRRARTRARLRAYGRGVWARAKQHGAHPVCTYMLLVLVGGRAESPVLAAETLKPLIDAGTDEGMWPDDDPAHRVMTLYAPDPRRLAAGVASIHMLVVPVPHSWGGWRALDWLLDTVHAGMGAMRMLAIGDADWLTSNMRLPQTQRKARQTRVMRQARPVWSDGVRLGAQVGVVCAVSYPDTRYYGDPDNTAETATALYGAGVALGAAPPIPRVFAFILDPEQCAGHTHVMRLLCFAMPQSVDVVDRVVGCAPDVCPTTRGVIGWVRHGARIGGRAALGIGWLG